MSNIQITKQTITARSRKLKTSWTVEPLEPLETIFSGSLAKELREELDREIIWELLKTVHPDWTHVKIPRFANKALFEQDISEWCSENLKGNFNGYREQWMFEIPADATWFILRWFSEEQKQ